MHATFELDDLLMAKLRQLAAQTNRTIDDVVAEALRNATAQVKQPRPPQIARLPVSNREPGLMPGVNLDSMQSLLDLLERDDDAA